MKTILAYGDSLTYGTDVEKQARHAFADRWPSELEAGLAGAARVIAEGLGGRTTAFDDLTGPTDRNGARLLPTILQTHAPLDLVILFLGTNDLKTYVNGTALGAAMGIKRLVQIVRSFPFTYNLPAPKVLIVAPPLCIEPAGPTPYPMFSARGAESHLFADYYQRVARELDCGFFDAATVTTPSPIDGVHLDAANTRAIGAALVPVVKSLLAL